MDAVTKDILAQLAARHPHKAIHLSHQFLDGLEGKPCGMVPNDWDGGEVRVTGRWWYGKSACRIEVVN